MPRAFHTDASTQHSTLDCRYSTISRTNACWAPRVPSGDPTPRLVDTSSDVYLTRARDLPLRCGEAMLPPPPPPDNASDVSRSEAGLMVPDPTVLEARITGSRCTSWW